ncbi:DNA end-binding protein Ku [Cupriavidus gilardii J11]|uniref:Non-homologous end joining protein Ku n=1 Tax=Cupriavidus gilardii J11 TaxID=936133 RepID=A0A562B8F2_9BURK|nr:Ku protein [Cupriavidus gilardii]TWG81481.1 DNA end-binding protein Ku [Cupriavidus gilardii J11]
MPRIIWKGAISFGLVNIPVVLKAAARDNALDFDWLDDRDMAPVGYQRINKRTGKPVDKDHIVKGYQYEKGEYVLMSPEDFRQANVEATQTVDIVSFVKADQIPPYYFETPYYLEPDRRGEKGYALLRETLRRTGRAALALVVIHNRQHLAALLVTGDALILNTMRWAEEVLPMDDLRLPKSSGKQDKVSAREIEMAERLVEDMQEDWSPETYRDTYREDLMERIESKIAAGNTHLLTPAEEGAQEPRRSADVIDMMALLRESIKRRGGKGSADDDTAGGDEGDTAEEVEPKRPARKTARKTAGKTASKRTSAKTTRGSSKTMAKASGKESGEKRKRA